MIGGVEWCFEVGPDDYATGSIFDLVGVPDGGRRSRDLGRCLTLKELTKETARLVAAPRRFNASAAWAFRRLIPSAFW